MVSCTAVTENEPINKKQTQDNLENKISEVGIIAVLSIKRFFHWLLDYKLSGKCDLRKFTGFHRLLKRERTTKKPSVSLKQISGND